MKNLKKHLIKLGATVSLSSLLTLSLVQPAFADIDPIADALLQQISSTTNSILNQINMLPAYIVTITQMASSWLTTNDPANTIGNNQNSIVTLANDYVANYNNQINLTQNNTRQFLLSGSQSKHPLLPKTANELSYAILAGQVLNPDPNNPPPVDTLMNNYIAHLSGNDFVITQPTYDSKNPDAQYQSYYNTLNAIRSFNTFVISGLYTQQDKDGMRADLINKATNPDWFHQIASEDLGLVLRQILMYDSQLYVQLDRLITLQQQQTAAQAMTNTLLMLLSQTTGDQLWGK